MAKRAVFIVILVVLFSSLAYAEEFTDSGELFQDISTDSEVVTSSTKIQTTDIDFYVESYKSEMNDVMASAQNNIVGVASNVFENYDGFTFYDVGEIIDTRGNRQRLYDLWKDDEVFISSEGIVVNDHTANNVVYTLSNGNKGLARTDDGTILSSDGTTKVDKLASNVVVFNGDQLLSGPGTDLFVPPQKYMQTNSKYTYNLDNKIGVIPNYGDIESDYFQPFSFGVTGFMISQITGRAIEGAWNYPLLVSIYNDAGMSNSALLRKNTVAIDDKGSSYKVKANCCSYLYFADTREEKAFPIIARSRLKGDTGVVLDKDVKIANKYEVTDGQYTYSIEPSPFGTVVKTNKGKVIQSSNMLPYTPRNDKEARLLSS